MKTNSHYISLILIVVILVLIISGIFIITNWIISQKIEQQIDSKIQQYQNYVELINSQAVEILSDLTKSIESDSTFITSLTLHDPEEINSILKNYILRNKKIITLTTDSIGNILTKSEILNGISGLSELQNMDNSINFWNIKNEWYLVRTLSIDNDSIFVGTLSLGFPLSEVFSQTNSGDNNFAILNNNKLMYSSYNYSRNTISEFVKTHQPIIDAILTTSLPSDIFITEIADTEVYCKLLPFENNNFTYILIVVSKNNEYHFLDLLFEYYIYIFSLGSFFIIIILFISAKHQSKQMWNQNNTIQNLKTNTMNTEYNLEMEKEINGDLNSDSIQKSEGTLLYTKIINSVIPDKKNEESRLNIINNLLNIQIELIELYSGKIEKVLNNKIIATFIGNNESVENALQCSLAIMKLISKEKDSKDFQVGIGLNFGKLYFSNSKHSNIFGDTLELTESILNVAKPNQILMNIKLLNMISGNYSTSNTKIWKFNSSQQEIKLVSVNQEIR